MKQTHCRITANWMRSRHESAIGERDVNIAQVRPHSRSGLLAFLAHAALLATTGIFLWPNLAWAQISTPLIPTAEHVNGIGFGLSYGEQTERDADFYGWSFDYSRRLGDRWTLGTSLTWDEETESFRDKPDKSIKTYNLLGTISYSLTPNLAITTGLGKGIANDGNDDNDMRFTNGDLSTGLSLGYSIPLSDRYSIGASVAYEYNISESETSYSMDLTLGWNF